MAGSIAAVLCSLTGIASAETFEIIANHEWTIEVFGKQYGVIEWGYGSNDSLFGSESTTEIFFADRAVFSIGIPLGWIAGVMAALIAGAAVIAVLIRGRRDSAEEGSIGE